MAREFTIRPTPIITSTEHKALDSYCDHKRTNTCRDCLNLIIELRQRIRSLETELKQFKEKYKDDIRYI